MWQLIILDVIISLLDIFFLIILLFVIGYYTRSARFVTADSWPVQILNKKPLLLIGIFTLLFALKNWLALSVSKKQYYFIYGIALRISENKLSNYLEGSYSNYVNIDSSVHFRTIFNNPLEFAHYVLRGSQQIISQAILIIFALIPIIIFKPVLFSLLLLILLPPVFFLLFFMKKKMQVIHDSAKTIHSKLIQHLKEAITGFVESNIYDRKHFFLNRFLNYLVQQSRSFTEQQIIQSFPPRLIEVFAVFGLFILVVINFYTGNKAIDLITIGAFMAAAYKIIPGIVKILNSLGQIKAHEFIVQSLLQNQPIDRQNKLLQNETITSVTFSNVAFGYPNKDVLNNFNLEIKSGDFIGLSGKSGKGKTTAINLLLGFLEPHSGFLLINGLAKEAPDRRCYWKNISYVQQQSFLINDTILHNITLQENDHDWQRLNDVIKITGLNELTGNMPGGLEKPVTEDGKNISGGQRQRIALARALYKNADLIILDEPFNELDKESENSILYHLKMMAKSGKIIILITHDKESFSYCSKIISLDEP